MVAVFRRSGRCVVRTFSVVRVAARRTVEVIAHPGQRLRGQHTVNGQKELSPRIRSVSLSSPRSPLYSPISPARRVFTRQAAYFSEKGKAESLQDVLSEIEPHEFYVEEDDLSPPVWVTVVSATLTAICVFYAFMAMNARAGTSRLSHFFGFILVACLGSGTAISVLSVFAPYYLGMHRGSLEILFDFLGIPIPRESSSDTFSDHHSLQEEANENIDAINQQEQKTTARYLEDLAEPKQKKEVPESSLEDDEDDDHEQDTRRVEISPTASGAHLASEEESLTARSAIMRCRVLLEENDESNAEDPFLHVISFELKGYDPHLMHQTVWAGPNGKDFYAHFLNTCAKNKNAQADEWQKTESHEIRAMTTLHPLATNIRFPGLNLVIPTTKSQRAYQNLEFPTCLALFERSKFGGIPFGDALRVETVWIFEPCTTLEREDQDKSGHYQDDHAKKFIPETKNRESTRVRIYFRCLFIDKVFPIPRWVRRAAIGKTKIELATTYSKWRDHVLGIPRSPSIAIEKPLFTSTESMPMSQTPAIESGSEDIIQELPESLSDDRPHSLPLEGAAARKQSQLRRRHRSQQPAKNTFRSKQHSLDLDDASEHSTTRPRKGNGRRKSRAPADVIPPPPPKAPPLVIPDSSKTFEGFFCSTRKSSPPNTSASSVVGERLRTASFDDANFDRLTTPVPSSAPATFDDHHHRHDDKRSVRSRIRAPKLLFSTEKTPPKTKNQAKSVPKPGRPYLLTPPKLSKRHEKAKNTSTAIDTESDVVSQPNFPDSNNLPDSLTTSETELANTAPSQALQDEDTLSPMSRASNEGAQLL